MRQDDWGKNDSKDSGEWPDLDCYPFATPRDRDNLVVCGGRAVGAGSGWLRNRVNRFWDECLFGEGAGSRKGYIQ